jgi:membrane-bound lytic murein transglycosylase B
MPIRSCLRSVLLAALIPLPPAAIAGTQVDFAACIARLQQQAREEGISGPVVSRHLATVDFRERVIELDRQQPEFTQTFADYLGRRVTEQRIERGRELLSRHRPLLERVTREYGVPGRILVAFWGLETNYGEFFGGIPALDSLSTLACDPRRSGFFTDQLMDALRIIDEGAIEASRMEGSWAGALGNFQFMPSIFLRYAVDADGDGRRDLWHSLPDAVASAANFLRDAGWQAGERWGREVLLPDGFRYELTGRGQPRPLSEWRELGVRMRNGEPLPGSSMMASIIVPAGHRGPAFAVYDNFDVIMRWNRSQFYALSVGLLADRIAGAGPLRNPPPADEPRLSRDAVMALQQQLNRRGFDSGEPDGIVGPATRSAIRAFQQARGLVSDGHPGQEVLDALGVVPATES